MLKKQRRDQSPDQGGAVGHPLFPPVSQGRVGKEIREEAEVLSTLRQEDHSQHSSDEAEPIASGEPFTPDRVEEEADPVTGPAHGVRLSGMDRPQTAEDLFRARPLSIEEADGMEAGSEWRLAAAQSDAEASDESETPQDPTALRRAFSQETIDAFLKQTRGKGKKRIIPAVIRNLDQRRFYWRRDGWLLLAAFGLPFLIFLLIEAALGFAPFGDSSPMTVDLYHQYAPFLSALRDKLRQGESFWYSFRGGLGMNFLSTLAYYATSPFNLIFALLPETALPSWLTFLEAVKIGCCGLTFALFLRIGVSRTQAEKARDALIEQDSEELAELLPEGGFLSAQAQLDTTPWEMMTVQERRALRAHKKTQLKREVEDQNRRYDPQQLGILGCALLYALSGFMVTYSWNIMWLDVLIVFPLVLLGIHGLVHRGRFVLLTLSLAACVLLNYYMAFFVFAFSLYYFFYAASALPRGLDPEGRRKPKTYLWRMGQLGFSYLLAIGLSAILAWPVFLSLGLTSASSDAFPQTLTFSFSLFEFLSRHLFGVAPVIREGLPNLYAGLLVLIALPLYLACRKIRPAEKLSTLLFLGFLFLSFNNNVLNFIWHATHYPNQLPHRFAFVYVAFTLFIVFRVWQHLREITPRMIGLAAGLAGLYLLLAEVILKQAFDQTLLGSATLYLNLIFVALYAAVFLAGAQRSLPLRAVSMLLLILMGLEASLNTALTMNHIRTHEYYGSASAYVKDFKSVRARVAEIRQDDPTFYRIERREKKTADDPALYGYPGLSGFSSAGYAKMAQTLRRLGYEGNGLNSYSEQRATAGMDLLMGIKYLLAPAGLQDAFLEPVAQTSADSVEDNLSLYKRPQVLPVGYWVPQSASEFVFSEGHPLRTQNAWVKQLAATAQPLYAFEKIETTSNLKVAQAVDPETVSLDFQGQPETTEVSLQVTATVSGNLTLDLQTFQQTDLTVKGRWAQPVSPATPQGLAPTPAVTQDLAVNPSSTRGGGGPSEPLMPTAAPLKRPSGGEPLEESWQTTVYGPQVLDLGTVRAGQTVTLLIKQPTEQRGLIHLRAATLQPQALEAVYQALNPGGLQVTASNSNQIQGTFQAPEKGWLMLTIPYDPNWTIQLDGQPVEPQALNETFLAVPVQAGPHQLQMVYEPRGFKLGAFVSLGSLLILFVTGLVASAVRKKREEE